MSSVSRSRAVSLSRPLYSPESITTPSSVKAPSLTSGASGIVSPSQSSGFGAITGLISTPIFSANAWSRSSWPGTAISAPVPTSERTKSATKTGISSLVTGLVAGGPVATPFGSSPSGSASSSMKCRTSASDSASSSLIGWSGASAKNVAPWIVSTRVVNASTGPYSRGSVPSPRPFEALRASLTSKVKVVPCWRPIQLRCIWRTESGHPANPSIASNSSSAYSVISRNHWSRSRVSTGVSHRQHSSSSPSTCSSARTVSQEGHQFTSASRRSTSPASWKRRNSPLVPLVVVGGTGGDLAVPVVAEPHRLHLPFHRVDAVERPVAGFVSRSLAAFSAGSPNASHPIGWSTSSPRIRRYRAYASVIV